MGIYLRRFLFLEKKTKKNNHLVRAVIAAFGCQALIVFSLLKGEWRMGLVRKNLYPYLG
jgi:hypothetical protein